MEIRFNQDLVAEQVFDKLFYSEFWIFLCEKSTAYIIDLKK